MRYIPVLILASACGGLTVEESATTQASNLTCSAPICRGSVTNNFTSLPSENTYFCHPIGMSGSGAHSQAPILQWGVPSYGASHGLSASASSPSMAAIPNAKGPLPHSGSASIDVQCDRWTNFTLGAGNGYSPEWMHVWQSTGLPDFVSASTLLWDTNSICYLNGLGSVSVTGEKSWLDVPNGWNWGLNTSGFGHLTSVARCAWLGHVPNWNGSVWLLAKPGQPHNSGMPTGAGICLPYAVYGNLDDGSWKLNPASGQWVLEASGGISQVQAYCIPYN